MQLNMKCNATCLSNLFFTIKIIGASLLSVSMLYAADGVSNNAVPSSKSPLSDTVTISFDELKFDHPYPGNLPRPSRPSVQKAKDSKLAPNTHIKRLKIVNPGDTTKSAPSIKIKNGAVSIKSDSQ